MFIVSVWKTVLLPSQFTSWTIDRFVEYITTCMTMAGILSKVKVALSWIQAISIIKWCCNVVSFELATFFFSYGVVRGVIRRLRKSYKNSWRMGSRISNIISKGGLILISVFLIIIPIASASGDGSSYAAVGSEALSYTAAAIGGAAASTHAFLEGESKMEEGYDTNDENAEDNHNQNSELISHFGKMSKRKNTRRVLGGMNNEPEGRMHRATKRFRESSTGRALRSAGNSASRVLNSAGSSASRALKSAGSVFSPNTSSSGDSDSNNISSSRSDDEESGNSIDSSSKNEGSGASFKGREDSLDKTDLWAAKDEARENANILYQSEKIKANDIDQDDVQANKHDADDDLDELMHHNLLEGELDMDGNEKQLSITEEVLDDDTINFGSGQFQQEYDQLHRIAMNNIDSLNGMRKVIAKLIRYVHVTKANLHKKTKEELLKEFNRKRDEIGTAMEDQLKENKLGRYIKHINMGTKFSICHVIVFVLHYAPIGTRHTKGDKYDYCNPNQCCISTMMSKLLNFLVNEDEHGSEQMQTWNFGGKWDEDKSDCMAVVDLIPFLLEKKDNNSEMKKQYEAFRTRLGLHTIYELMMIPYCLLQMHILLFQKCRSDIQLQIHVCSSATAKYLFGFETGLKKYLTKFIGGATYVISFGLHPQGESELNLVLDTRPPL